MEAVDLELERLIERRSRNGEVDPDEREESWKASVRRYNARLQEENRQAWCEYHRETAIRLRVTLQNLISHHEAEAARLAED